eukprot:13388066-Alexandrium_andersonii.AAC.1
MEHQQHQGSTDEREFIEVESSSSNVRKCVADCSTAYRYMKCIGELDSVCSVQFLFGRFVQRPQSIL